MKVDLYRSRSKPSYGLVAPASADIHAFKGDVGAAIGRLAPLDKKGTHELSSVYHGDLLDFLERQIAEHGIGLVKVQTHFSEVPN
jgi:hypothetical protein